jgi:miniconductance mechanosensitive channel
MIEELQTYHPALPAAAGIALLLLVAGIAWLIAKFIAIRLLSALTARTRASWDDAFATTGLFSRIAQLLPGLIIYSGIRLVPDLTPVAVALIQNVAMAYVILMAVLAISSALGAVSRIYSRHPASRRTPIKGFVQLAQIIVFVVGGILIVATLIDRSPAVLLGGFGAMTAVLMLVFKDTILGLVASVQLSAQDMVRVGDWIEMPRFDADGDVIDVSLHTVKVQNWDKTVTMIPSHMLISDSFRNWRGMTESGGRRIKRSVYIDIESIRFLEDDEVHRFRRFALLKEYIERKEQELRDYNAALKEETQDDVNMRRLTNVGTLRAYIFNYLKNHPRIHQGMTLLVRQLSSGPEGLPIEIYAFTNTTAWAEYEDIQSDIFDHVLSIVREFGLRVYQKPAGHDLRRAFAAD